MACCWIALLVACGLTQMAGTASAAEAEAAASATSSGPPPTVSFVDEGPLELDKEAVKKAVEAGALEVKVHNGSSQPQQVTVEVIGLEGSDPAIEALFAGASETSEVAPGATGTVPLPLAQQQLKPAEKTYSLGLVASGTSGGLARRELAISYEPPPATEAPNENSLNPNRPIDITLHAVNYLPSLLSSLLGLGVFVALTLCLVAAVFWKWLDRKLRCLPVALIALAGLIGVLCLVGAIKDGPWGQPSLHAISSRPIKVAPGVPEGTLGTVSAEDGSIAQLVSAKQKLRPENLDGAEKLSGKYSLEAKHEKAEAEATVEVRDYWIWAVVAISLGLLIGLLLRRWFQERRPAMKLRARLQKALQDYEAGIELSEENDAGRPYEKTAIGKRVHARKIEIEGLIKLGESAVAGEKVTALTAYVGRFAELREKLRKLDAVCAELLRTPRLAILRFDLGEATGYEEARAMLRLDIDSPALDSGEEELKAQITTVDAQIDLIRLTTVGVKDSIRHLLILEKARKELTLTGGQPTQFREIENELFDAAAATLQSSNGDQLLEARVEDHKAMRKLGALTRPEGIDEPGLDLSIVVPWDLLPPKVGTALDDDAAGLLGVRFSATRPLENVSVDNATITPTVEGPDEKDRRIHVGDAVRFKIDFGKVVPSALQHIEVDFGDNSPPRKVLVPRGREKISVRHRYQHVGTPTVRVLSAASGKVLGQAPLEAIFEEPRPTGLEVKLAEGERATTVAAFVLAIASGLGALYFTDASWGQPMNYLAAIVWGGATGEGVKFAAAIADRVWPVPG